MSPLFLRSVIKTRKELPSIEAAENAQQVKALAPKNTFSLRIFEG